MSDIVNQRAQETEQRLEVVRQRGAEMYQGNMQAQEERNGLFGRRAELDQERLMVDRAIWPFAGLFPEPEQVRLHVIPAGMWRYSVPLTPALESMVPPGPLADPNAAVLERIAAGIDFMVDTQAEGDPAGERRAELSFRSQERRRAAGDPTVDQEAVDQRVDQRAEQREQHREQREAQRAEHQRPPNKSS